MFKAKNFNEDPIDFQEFIGRDKKGMINYNNFFFNFYNYRQELRNNYIMLKKINEALARELSDSYDKYFLRCEPVDIESKVNGHYFPREILEKGYQAYLLLRSNYKEDGDLIKKISDYNEGDDERSPDDWAAFFS